MEVKSRKHTYYFLMSFIVAENLAAKAAQISAIFSTLIS